MLATRVEPGVVDPARRSITSRAVITSDGTVGYLSSATGSVLATDQAITTQSEGSASGEQLTDLIEISSGAVAGYSGGASDIVGYAISIAKVLRVADALGSGTQSTSYTYDYPAFLGGAGQRTAAAALRNLSACASPAV